RAHLVVPYSLVTNDCRYVLGTGFASPGDFFTYGKATIDRRRNDGDDYGRMMSSGVHPRITGHPARADALARLLDYSQQVAGGDPMRRSDIAPSFAKQVPPDAAYAAAISAMGRSSHEPRT